MLAFVFILEQLIVFNSVLLLILLIVAFGFILMLLIPVQVRRLHDLNLSGHWMWAIILLNFISGRVPEYNVLDFISMGIVIALAIIPSQHKSNRFGADPTANIKGFYEYYSSGMHNKYGAYGLQQTNRSGMSSFHGGYNNFSGSDLFKQTMQRPATHSNSQKPNQNHYSSINQD